MSRLLVLLGAIVLWLLFVTLRVTLPPNYLHYKLNQASSALVHELVEI
jgi:uncharacterized membrane-anchored protein